MTNRLLFAMSLARPCACLAATLFLILAVIQPGNAQTPPPPKSAAAAPIAVPLKLTIENIMRGPELFGYAPSSVRWSLDSRQVFFRWKQPGEPSRKDPDWYVADRAGTAPPRRLTEDEAREQVSPGPAGDLTEDRRRAVYADEGDLFVMEADVPGRRRLTDTTETESSPRWTRDEKRVAFVRNNNLFVLPVDGPAALVQMTDIRAGGPSEPGGPPRLPDVPRIAQETEKTLIEAIREQAARRAEAEAKRKAREATRRKPYTPPARHTVLDLRLSPDETQVLVTVGEGVGGASAARTSLVPQFVTESGYVSAPPGRPNVGEEGARVRYVLLDVKTGEARPVDPPEALAARGLSFSGARWSKDGARLAIVARARDNKDRWVLLVDRVTGKTTVTHATHDDAWIGGPGWSSFGWMPDGERLWVVSEQPTGFAHLYVVPASGTGGTAPAPFTAFTAGRWELFDPELSAAGTAWYFTSSEVHPGERHFYQMAAANEAGAAARVRLTALPGRNDVTLSPDERTLAVIHSYTNRPPELYLQANAPGAAPRRVTLSSTPAFRSYAWRDMPLVTFAARDGATVTARLFTPTKRAGQGRGSAVIFAHGAGYLQNAHRWWSSYEREYAFHHFLAEQGYTVLDVDYRGSAGYGRDVRTAIYKHMGGKDLDDLIDAARWLVRTQSVDARRIGVYGGSYGGFLTLMGLFKAPDTFAAGAALRPVTDWTKYNHPYTANILGLPQEDYAAYQRSSPIFFASGLRGALLICHGMVDANVFFQDTVRLQQRLIELGKDDWEVAAYPVEDHAFVHPSSWTDEYKRIFRLFERVLKKP